MNDNKAAITVRVLAGRRLDALAAAESRTLAMFPGFHCFTVLLTFGSKQTDKQKPRYCFSAYSDAAMPSSRSMPTSIGAMAARAKKKDRVRLRCLSKDCPLRSDAEVAALTAAINDPKQNKSLQTREIDVDDKADLGVDEDNENDDASSSDSDEPLARPEADKHNYIRAVSFRILEGVLWRVMLFCW